MLTDLQSRSSIVKLYLLTMWKMTMFGTISKPFKQYMLLLGLMMILPGLSFEVFSVIVMWTETRTDSKEF